MNLIGCGVALALVQVPHSVRVLGEVLLLLPLPGVERTCVLGIGSFMSHMSSTLAVIPLYLVLIISPLAWFWLFQVALFGLPFCLWGLWPLLLPFWFLFLWPWFDPCYWGFCGVFWAPLAVAIKESNCCCISVHFAQGFWWGALGSGLVFPSLPSGTSLTTLDIEAYLQ